MNPVKISVVIITFNEEKNIARCLDAVKTIADEIVIVDSFSKDRTKEICMSYGVKFVENAFEGHIQQKNYAITQASYPHVLSLDADEVLNEELIRSIQKVKADWQADGYYVKRLTSYCGQWIWHSAWYPDRKLRLWDSRKGSWGGQNPHDKYIMQKGSKTKVLEGQLLHYSFHTVKQHIDQMNFFSEIVAKELYAKRFQPNFYHYFIKPPLRFFIDYIVKRGFLDGFNGLAICKASAHGKFLVYAKLRDLYRQEKEGSR